MKFKLQFIVGMTILKKCGHYWHENMDDFFREVKGFLKKIS